jgi:hypothetical protein
MKTGACPSQTGICGVEEPRAGRQKGVKEEVEVNID